MRSVTAVVITPWFQHKLKAQATGLVCAMSQQGLDQYLCFSQLQSHALLNFQRCVENLPVPQKSESCDQQQKLASSVHVSREDNFTTTS